MESVQQLNSLSHFWCTLTLGSYYFLFITNSSSRKPLIFFPSSRKPTQSLTLLEIAQLPLLSNTNSTPLQSLCQTLQNQLQSGRSYSISVYNGYGFSRRQRHSYFSIPPTSPAKKVKKTSKKEKTSQVRLNSSSPSASIKKKKRKKSKSESKRSFTMSELHVDPLPSSGVATPVINPAEENVDASGKNSLNQGLDIPNYVETLGLKDPAVSEKLGKNVPNPPTTVDANIGASTETNNVVATESLKKTGPEPHVASSVVTPDAEPNVVPDVTTSLAPENLVNYFESDESPQPKSADKEDYEIPYVVIVNETTISDKSVPTNSEASVARRTRSRAGKSVEIVNTPVQTPKPTRAAKGTGKKPLYGPPKPVSKVVPRTEEKGKAKKWKAPPTSDSERLALERNLKEDILQCQSVVEAIEYAASPEYRQVFVCGKCVKFSQTVINQYLQRHTEEVANLKVTDNEVCKVITGGKVKVWPTKAMLAETSLSPLYAILNRVAAHNWVPTTH
ncbi:uncharacterized protein LOC123886862 [Trifolium pratense]|uniref:uncharacterized protein LOC123886862 n=1 Tax=Trifolium pratense TaxID=57577 RepID=UPI001E690555|nr:uncharacterized protein LOC123886862 [Trifolium pratense]